MASCISRCKDTIFSLSQSQRLRQHVYNKRAIRATTRGKKSTDSRSKSLIIQERFEGEAAKDYKGEVIVGMSVGEVSTPSE